MNERVHCTCSYSVLELLTETFLEKVSIIVFEKFLLTSWKLIIYHRILLLYCANVVGVDFPTCFESWISLTLSGPYFSPYI